MGLFSTLKDILQVSIQNTQNIDALSYKEKNHKNNDINYNFLPDKSNIMVDVIMLYNFYKKPTIVNYDINDYPQYFIYRYKVNPIKLINRLILEEYLIKGLKQSNINDFISSLKMNELKKLLQLKNQKSSGKKELLVNKVIANYNLNEICDLYPYINNVYFVTNKGKTLIEENYDLIQLHQHYSQYMIEYYDYMQSKSKINSSSFYEICIDVFKQREQQYILNGELWGFLANTYFNIYAAYKNLNNNNLACKYLVKSIYIDLSGISNNNIVTELNNTTLRLSKFLIPLKEYYREEYLKDCLNIPLPFHYFGITTLKKIFNDMINECADINKYRITHKPKLNQKEYKYFR